MFERSESPLKGRGAGIGTPPSVIRIFRDRGMVDSDLSCFHVERLAHIGRTSGGHLGGTSWVTPFTIELLNWGGVSKEDLPAFLVDRTGRQHAGSLPPGSMRFEEEFRLKEVARESFPPYFADIIGSSQDTFIQAIYTVAVTRYRNGRMCLAGDAGAFVQPFTASGVFRGMRNVLDLAEGVGWVRGCRQSPH